MAKTIVLGYKGSTKSGNYAHAGRAGKVGGSMPRNYGAAVTALGAAGPAFTNAQGQYVTANNQVIDLTSLNRIGLQAIIDAQAGKITWSNADVILSMAGSQKGAVGAGMNAANQRLAQYGGGTATPAPAATPQPAVAPPATPPPAPTPVVTPPAQPTTYQPIPAGQPHAGYVPTQADVDAAKATLAALQDPNDPRGAVHSSWAAGIDPNNLTSAQIKVLSIYGSGGMRGATLKTAMTAQQPAAAPAAKPAAAPTPPPAKAAGPYDSMKFADASKSVIDDVKSGTFKGEWKKDGARLYSEAKLDLPEGGYAMLRTFRRQYVTGSYVSGTTSQQRYETGVEVVTFQKKGEDRYSRWTGEALLSIKTKTDQDAAKKAEERAIKKFEELTKGMK